jgi:hypothetical protein
LIRANADTLFTAHPSALAVARPKRITGRGKLADRRRATPQDGCAAETYEKVEAAR